MKDNFDPACDILFEIEKYSANVKGDPGGRTIWGITEKFFPEHVKKMLAMTPEDSKEYAKGFYRLLWNEFGCDNLKYPQDLIVFICAVNPGPGFVRGLRGMLDWKDVLFEAIAYFNKEAQDESYEKACCYSGNCIKMRARCDRRFLRGWVNRVLTLWVKVRKGAPERHP